MKLIGILTPSGNPTVEPEFARLFGNDASMVAARLCGEGATMIDRLRDYAGRVDETVATFGGMPLDALGFAVTGTSYLIGAAAEAKLNMLTSPLATRQALAELGVSRIALVCPYPAELIPPALAYWKAAGIEIVDLVEVARTPNAAHPIFDLTDEAIAAATRRACDGAGEAVLLTGTGMRSLRAISMVETAKPLLSSNLCLAWALLRSVGTSYELRAWANAARSWSRIRA